ncbi:hypothetical protein X777_09758, partial [Ooceraea biroi]
EVDFADILDEESDEDRAVSDDSDYDSDCEENREDRTNKIVLNSELQTLNRQKHCAIYFYYYMGGDYAVYTPCMTDMEQSVQSERDLLEQANRIATLVEYFEWVQQCDECIGQLEERCGAKRPRLSIGNRQSVVARIVRLEGERKQLERRFIHFGGGDYASAGHSSSAELSWRKINTVFESRIVTGAIINTDYIEPRRFLEDAGSVVLEQVQNAIESCLHYFYLKEKLEAHTVDCQQMNDCAIVLPNEDDK